MYAIRSYYDYRSPIDFADQQLDEAGHALARCYEALDQASKVVPAAAGGEIPGELAEAAAKLDELDARFCEAMDDDFIV